VQVYQPDIIYLRYGIYVYPAHRLIRIAPVVEEINTNDLTQHEELGGVYHLYNRLTRGIFLRHVSGLVTVSRELEISPAFASYKKTTRTIANGIALSEITPFAGPDNEIPRLVFVATPGYFWHGEDKLVLLASRFPDLLIDVIGFNRLAATGSVPKNILLHGYLEHKTYEGVLARADAALGTLALHRKGMEEACPLKTRECLAFGLPMVLPYKDTDLDDLDCDFLLKIPNKEDNIQTHGDAIREFAYRMRGKRADRALIEPRIDSKHKETMRLKFFEEILQSKAGSR
jgi:hypothetical protein